MTNFSEGVDVVTPSLFHETLNEAVKDCVNAAGSAKAVACKLWPEKAPDAAHRLLLSCLNEDRPEHLTPEQLVMVLRLARAKSCHIGVAYILRDLGYADPQPIEPRDEAAELQRAFMASVEAQRLILARMERLSPALTPSVLRAA